MNHPSCQKSVLCLRVAENIKRIRRLHGWTQRELAEQLGASFSLVQKYELGLATPPLTEFEHLSIVLRFPPHMLLCDLSQLTCDELREVIKNAGGGPHA